METICLHFELPATAEPMAEPNRTARRLARENRILRRTCAACLAAMFAALAWDGWQTHKTYDLLKTSARQTAQAAEQRAQDYRAEAERLQCQLDGANQRADEYQTEAEDLQRRLDAVTAAYMEGTEQ